MTRTASRRLLRHSRPRFWFYLAGPVIVGAAFGAEGPDAFIATASALLFAYFLLPANLLLYGVNDLADADTDRRNPKKVDRETRYVGGTLLPSAVVAAGLLGLALAVWLGDTAGWWIVLFLVLAGAYSLPPVRLKARPFLDSVSNGLYIAPGVAAYYATGGHPLPAAALVGGWLWTMAMHTYSAIPDIEPDRRAGLTTTAVLLGQKATLAYCGIVWTGAALAWGVLHPLLGLVFVLYPALLVATVVRRVAIERAYWWYPVLNVGVGTALSLAGMLRWLAGA